jgi:hypothetical protein
MDRICSCCECRPRRRGGACPARFFPPSAPPARVCDAQPILGLNTGRSKPPNPHPENRRAAPPKGILRNYDAATRRRARFGLIRAPEARHISQRQPARRGGLPADHLRRGTIHRAHPSLATSSSSHPCPARPPRLRLRVKDRTLKPARLRHPKGVFGIKARPPTYSITHRITCSVRDPTTGPISAGFNQWCTIECGNYALRPG